MRTIERTEKFEVVGLSTDELIQICMNIEKGTFGYFEIHTIVSMNKTGNPFYNLVKKITKGKILIGGKVNEDDLTNYEKRVIKNTGDEDFKSQKNNVGNHIEGSPVLYNEKLDRYYLQYEWFEEVLPKSEFEFEGNPIEKQMFRDYMRSYTPNKYGVNVQSVKFENLKRLHINHIQYVVENEVEVEG